MKVVLGLGNPGSRYSATRHNIGWMVLDAVAEELHTVFRAGRGDYFQARADFAGGEVLLVKPVTYMNNSGLAAVQVLELFGVVPGDMLVVADELQFPVGRIQLKPGGSDSGHNGLSSLIYHLMRQDFPRLRCGIGNEFQQGRMADYVLDVFPAGQAAEVESMTGAACQAVLTWLRLGTDKAMGIVNVRPRDKPGPAPPPDRPAGLDEQEKISDQ